MPLKPNIPKQKRSFLVKECPICKQQLVEEDFTKTHSIFYPDGVLPICNDCITDYLKESDFSWRAVDKVCQWADIPFIVKEFERLRELNSDDKVWGVYAKVFATEEYQNLGWDSYNSQYLELKKVGLIEDEIPLVREKHFEELRRRWGANYDDDELYYLEDLYKGLLLSQNVSGALSIDQAQKLCKLSLEIDKRIRAGDKDVDKFLSSYDKIVKTADFTPKTAKNATDFDSIGELMLWLEKRGHQNKFYDDTTRDVIDETLKNIEAWNQRLYVNEGGLGDEVTARLQALQNISKSDNYYDLQEESFDMDKYEAEAFKEEEEEEFEIGGSSQCQ